MLNPDQFSPKKSLREQYFSDYGSMRATPEGYLSNLMVMPEYRGQGHARNIMNMAISDADSMGIPLTGHAKPELIEGFYSKLGFEPSENVPLAPATKSFVGMRREPRAQ